MKESEIIELAAQCGYECERAIALKLEASGREYWRLICDSNNLVLCFLDSAHGSHLKFCNLADALSAYNINVPKILLHKPELGITIQEDLGDDDLLEIVDESNKEELTYKSLELLIQIQEIPDLNISRLSEEALSEQVNLFSGVFCNEFLQIEADQSILELSNTVIRNLSDHPKLNCHFDFERRNLIASENNVISVIDFQDLCIGPIGIDLAGILLDHYLLFDETFVKDSLAFYKTKSSVNLNTDELFECFRWGGIQRNMRILGTLSRLYINDNRSFRLNDLPMILDNLISIIPDNWACKNYMIDIIQPKLTKKLASI